MKVSIEIIGDMVHMDYKFGEGSHHSEHKFWPDDFVLLLTTIERIRSRTSTAEQRIDSAKRILEGKSTWSDHLK
jgi:hypothetical protein